MPSALDPDTVRGSTAVAGRPEQEEAVLPNPVDIEDTTVPGGPSGQVPVRILRPRAPAGRCR